MLLQYLVFSSLRNLQLEEWGNNVTVVSCDMRKWQAPEKVLLLYNIYNICTILKKIFAYLSIKIISTIFTRIVLPLNSTAVHYYFSTNNLDFMINFNCSAPSNSAAI